MIRLLPVLVALAAAACGSRQSPKTVVKVEVGCAELCRSDYRDCQREVSPKEEELLCAAPLDYCMAKCPAETR